MSPRSEEFMATARRHLDAARVLLRSGIPENAAGEAYFAMLNAARAALSEEDRYAKTHKGTWMLFDDLFVQSGGIDRELAQSADRAKELREDSDYRAGGASEEEAETTVAAAERFVDAIETLFD